ncbi:MAG: hypothetical protein SP1CHLAM54_14880 [Chlamydiia bacterium]|nr:hypothetical protein [Chlamydiia bacterium]MCH9616378.1 hypothetical protein [Chlamydiia bacterium]MCH9629636.1 hypothetical protein [Chlamydiia bacterium]
MKLFISSLFVLSTISAFGLESNSTKIKKLEERINALEEGTSRIASPQVDGYGVQLGIEPIYWRAKIEGTEIAYSNQAATTSVPIKGDTIDVNPSWKWGLRVHATKFFQYDGWDLDVNFLFYRPRGSEGTSRSTANGRIPLKSGLITSGLINKATSELSMNYYCLNGELGKHFFVSNHLSLRLFASLQSVWLDIEQDTNYSGGNVLGPHTSEIREKNDFWGMGPRLGVMTKWDFGSGVYFDAMVAPALLYGYYDVRYKEERTLSTLQKINLRDQKHRFAPNVQFKASLGWGGYVNEKKQYIDVGFGYEAQFYFNQNQMLYFYELNPLRYKNYDGDLGMHGVTFRLNVTF